MPSSPKGQGGNEHTTPPPTWHPIAAKAVKKSQGDQLIRIDTRPIAAIQQAQNRPFRRQVQLRAAKKHLSKPQTNQKGR